MNNKIKGTLEAILIILIIIQPLFDVYMAIIGESLDIFGISIVTLLRTTTCVALVTITGIYQIKNKHKLKWLIALVVYLLFVVIYAVLHHFNISLSGGYFVAHGLYDFLTELMYVLRLVVPVILIYTILIVKPDKNQIEKAIISVVFIISLVIIITNLFKTSYASYSPVNKFVEYNLLDWFKSNDLLYQKTLSKGLFVSANQIGALLAILLPIVIMYILKKNKIFTYIVLLLAIVSMVLVGTRVANYGFMIAIITMLLAAIVIGMLKKQKIEYVRITAIFCIFMVGMMIYYHSPARNREIIDNEMYAIDVEDLSEVETYIPLEDFKNILEDEELLKEYVDGEIDVSATDYDIRYAAMCKYIKENYMYHSITRKYIVNIYPYTEDPEFWFELFDKPVSVKGNNRSRQSVIIKRIKELNNNKLYDTILGMGATPMNQREYMIENDLISHYYNIGIAGIILFVAPYAVIVIYATITMLKDIKNRMSLRLVTYIIAIIMTYCVGYFAGHVIDEYIITIYVATISGLALNHVEQIKGGKNERDNA